MSQKSYFYNNFGKLDQFSYFWTVKFVQELQRKLEINLKLPLLHGNTATFLPLPRLSWYYQIPRYHVLL